LKPEVFDVARNVQALSDMIRTLIGPRIEIAILGPEEPCFVNADAGQFETAIINMAVNARDAMEGRGRLTIAVGMAASLPTAAAPSHHPYGYVAVSVADTGSGITPDQFERIFEPFFTTKQVGQGTGLGLSQVFGFAKQSGGEVSVASEVGKGSIFTLYLPRTADSEKARPAPSTGSTAIAGDGMSVLMVEDNVDLGRFTADALNELGYAIKLVHGATHALEELDTGSTGFDVVFTDVVMPGMSGLELAQEVRRNHPDLPVVLTSGYSHVLSEHGSHGFELLQKPYSIEQLSNVLHRLGRQKPRQAARSA
jgi:two-component system, NtrC family, sensor kinase